MLAVFQRYKTKAIHNKETGAVAVTTDVSSISKIQPRIIFGGKQFEISDIERSRNDRSFAVYQRYKRMYLLDI